MLTLSSSVFGRWPYKKRATRRPHLDRDTVNSVGFIPKRLPFTTSNTIVRTFRHAISLDERRAKFKANLWNRPNQNEERLGIHHSPEKHSSMHNGSRHVHSNSDVTTKKGQPEFERQYSTQSVLTDVEEVNPHVARNAQLILKKGLVCWVSLWSVLSLFPTISRLIFSDVGGGSVANTVKYNLARIPLRWMIRECFKANTGIMFHSDLLEQIGLDPGRLWPEVLPRPPHLPVPSDRHVQRIPRPMSEKKAAKEIVAETLKEKKHESTEHCATEEEHELNDALSPIYDQLSLVMPWWILELLPLKHKYQRHDNSWVTTYRMNLGNPRIIPRQKTHGVKVHRSVKMRLEALYENGSKYAPRARLDHAQTTWVD